MINIIGNILGWLIVGIPIITYFLDWVMRKEKNKMERVINKHIFVWLGCFLGGHLGLDRFMRGQILWGILKLITLGGLGIWYLVDLCIAAYKAYGYDKVSENIIFKEGKWE